MPAEADVDADEARRHRQWMAEMQEKMASQSVEFAAGRSDLADEQRKCVQDIKEDANTAFRAGHVAKAITLYTEAIDMDRLVGNDDAVTAVLHANRAAAHLKQAEVGFDEAWEDADTSLSMNAQSSATRMATTHMAHASCAKAAASEPFVQRAVVPRDHQRRLDDSAGGEIAAGMAASGRRDAGCEHR